MSGNIQNIPLSVILSWPEPNYVDPVRRSWMPEYASILQVVSTLTVVTRFWLRARGKAGPLGLDDALLLPAWLASIVVTIFSILSTEKYGSGVHAWDVPITSFHRLSMCAWAAEVAFLVSTGCSKCSVLLFYRRLQKGTFNRRWQYCIIAAIALTIAYVLTFIFVLIFSCSPTKANWESANPMYHKKYSCINSRNVNLTSGTMSVVSDLYSVLLPCLMLRNFDAPKRQKIALNIIFSLGLIVVAAGAVRTYYFNYLWQTYDLTWAGYDVIIWAQLEMQLSLICASAPALRVFFRRYLSNPLRAFSSGRSNGNSTHNYRRRTSRLTDEPPSLITSQRQSSSILKPASAGKFDTLATTSEMELEMNESPPASTLRRSTTPHSDGSEYPLRDLEPSRPPAAYSLREKSSTEDYYLGDGIGTLPFYER